MCNKILQYPFHYIEEFFIIGRLEDTIYTQWQSNCRYVKSASYCRKKGSIHEHETNNYFAVLFISLLHNCIPKMFILKTLKSLIHKNFNTSFDINIFTVELNYLILESFKSEVLNLANTLGGWTCQTFIRQLFVIRQYCSLFCETNPLLTSSNHQSI